MDGPTPPALRRYVVDPETGCWLYQGRLSRGYGSATAGGKRWRVHRLADARLHGPLPPGVDVRQTCGRRDCIDDAHPEAVTEGEKTQRGASARLTPDDVRAVRRLRPTPDAPGAPTYAALGAMFGVNRSHAKDIVLRRRWKNID